MGTHIPSLPSCCQGLSVSSPLRQDKIVLWRMNRGSLPQLGPGPSPTHGLTKPWKISVPEITVNQKLVTFISVHKAELSDKISLVVSEENHIHNELALLHFGVITYKQYRNMSALNTGQVSLSVFPVHTKCNNLSAGLKTKLIMSRGKQHVVKMRTAKLYT